jgi:diguanylate cyclase (GGDEF)-like protein
VPGTKAIADLLFRKNGKNLHQHRSGRQRTGFPMKKALPLLAVLLAAIPCCWAAEPTPISTIRAIRSVSLSQAGQGLPVSFEGIVTFYHDVRHHLFVQDNGIGVFVKTTQNLRLVPGDRVQIDGKTDKGYRPSVIASSVKVLGHGRLPAPARVPFNRLISGKLDSSLVTVRGIVHSADMNMPSGVHQQAATLKVFTDGGYFEAQLLAADPQSLESLLDATVEITGVAGGKFDGKMQMTGVALHVTSLGDVKMVERAPVSAWSLPLTPLDEILKTYRVNYETRRVTVEGIVTYYEPGSAMVLESGQKSLWIMTDSFAPVPIGDHALATGFPNVANGFLVLTGAEVRDTGKFEPVRPQPLEWDQLALNRHILDLVSIEGRIITHVREAQQDEYVVASGEHVFSAVYPHEYIAHLPSPVREIQPGSIVRITGICLSNYANPLSHDGPFNILLRSPGDVEILADPSPLTVRNLGILTIGLLLALLVLGGRALYVDRITRVRLGELGYLSQRRAEILEDINNSRPLPEILERITELASVSLKGAPCWCEMADGLQLGNRPPEPDAPSLRVAERAIGHHYSHPAFGKLLAAFDARTIPQTDEDRALALASELATLAVENSRFHSELLHRSEYDMLTQVQNRFAFEKHLDKLIENAGQDSGNFGLIYIDLNDFKQVNDVHGHQVGDVFLQRVSERMKHKLRPADMLARLGGDEFAVLVPVVHHRTEVGEIAERLKHCFEEPILIDGHVLHGSASFGVAVFPMDATTRDGLLSIADAAMYVEKHARRNDDPGTGVDGEKLETESRA